MLSGLFNALSGRAMLLPQLATVAIGLLAIVASGQATIKPGAAAINSNYTIVCSSILRPGIPFRVGVALFQRSASHGIRLVEARINTTSRDSKFRHLRVDASWAPKGGEVNAALELSLLATGNPGDFDPVGSYSLEVTLLDTLGNRFVNRTDLTLSHSPVTTLIQTDKAVYKPGQLVKFRVVNLNESLAPVLTDMEVQIKDSRGNLVDKQLHNLSTLATWTAKAVMNGSFQLSDMPNEGDWNIEVKSDHGIETKSFNVRQYVLPKFTLKLTVPSFVHFNDSEFQVQAEVRYTFDKAVEGTFKMTMGPYMRCSSCKERYDQLETFDVDAPSDGVAKFSFNLDSWRSSLEPRGFTSRPHSFLARAMVEFKEKFTGEMRLTEADFYIYTTRYQVKVNTDQVPFFLPGFEVPVQIELQRPDNEPFTGDAKSNVTVTLTYHQRGKKRVIEVYQGPLNVAQSGTGVSLMVKIPVTSDFHPVSIRAKMNAGERSHQTSTISPFIGVTDDCVKISMKKKSGEDVEVDMKKTDGIRFLYYSVLSRGQMQQWGQYSDSDAKLTLTKALLTSYVSDVTVVAIGVAQNGELVASAVKHETSKLGGEVGITSNLTLNTGQPQDWARINVNAEPDSFVFITGIDASVNLIATGQDITQSTLAERYRSKVIGSRYWPRPQRLTTARVFQENSLIVMSDAFYYSDSDDYSSDSLYGGGGARSRSMLSSNMDYAPPPPSAKQSSGGTQVRKFFPETMVWTVVQTNSEGAGSLVFPLPDTITSWDVTAFAVASGKQIMTMNAPFKMITLKKFFIRPVLPYSIVRGEKFLLKVLVFNYQATSSEVNVTLNLTGTEADAKIVPGQASSSASGSKLLTIEVSVQPNSMGMALFQLTPLGLPTLGVVVSGGFRTLAGNRSYVETDVVVKSVIVVPEGRTVYKSRSVLLSPGRGDAGQRPEQTVEVQFDNSSDLVSGSEVFSYSLIGDVMGPAMQNIGGLLRLPSGCGEQNMVNFAPAVFIWEYLSSDQQQQDSEVREKAFQVMKLGLQRQLAYKRTDGSYSAFGQRDEAGSAWLTAFVLSVYARASAFIAIGPEALTGQSVQFLLGQQGPNGQFREPPGGRVFDRGLQGGAAQGSHGLTAFVCMALFDVDEVARARPEVQATTWKDLDVRGGISKCLWYMTSAFTSDAKSFSSYDLALSAYLLRRAQASSVHRQNTLQAGLEAQTAALEALAETTPNGGKYWSTTDPYWGRKVASVEATAWALLGSAAADNTEGALPMVRWLSNQQSSLGGFQTSQATVVGIRALAAFAAKSGLVAGDAGVELVFGGVTQAHAVKESRRLVLTQGKLARGVKAKVGSVLVRHASGTGFALVTLSWQYNLLDRQPLTADWRTANGLGLRLGEGPPKSPPAGGQFSLTVCAKANSSEGMLILRVTNPSGHSASQLPDTSRVSGLKRVEPGAQEIVLYFDYISAEGVCLTMGWTREVPVLELSPQLITLQKYYSTEQVVSASYLAPELKALTQCSVCPECPECNTRRAEESWLAWLT